MVKRKMRFLQQRKRLRNMHYIFNPAKELVQKRVIGQIPEIMLMMKKSSNVQIMKL